jgi:peptidoglycan/LPS O-acetylase OafA/YrhL
MELRVLTDIKYRPEIDGLRAIAVIPVILFHAGFSAFKGGYVGVDIFFVISGYLITRIIIDDLMSGKFTFSQFYWRRAKRILPVLFFIMICCIPFAWIWMMPSEFKNFSQSLIAVNLFVSNFTFWLNTGYFAPVSGNMPLLHTWSLAVEEQYYLFFPPLLLLIWRYCRKALLPTILLMAAISIGISEWGSRNAPSANFYLAPSRVWELFAGSICTLIQVKRKNNIDNNHNNYNFYSLIGIILILSSLFLFDKHTPFPSLYSLVPVSGAALILLYGTNETWVARLLSQKFIVTLGLMSYSAYLWHQPLFAFARLKNIYEPPIVIMGTLCLITFILAYITWRFVEQPCRKLNCKVKASIIFVAISLSIIVFGSIGNFYLYKKIPFPTNIKWEDLGQKRADIGTVCTVSASNTFDGLKLCYFGDKESSETVALYGDSHSAALSYELQKEFIKRKIRGVIIQARGCEEIPKEALLPITRKLSSLDSALITKECLPSFNSLLNYIHETVTSVIIANRWTFRLYPLEGYTDDLFVDNGEGGIEPKDGYRKFAALNDDNQLTLDVDAKKAALNHMMRSFAQTGKRIFLVYPVPELGWNITKENALAYRKTGKILDQLSVSKEFYDKRNAFVLEVFNQLSEDNIFKIRTDKIFCDSFIPKRCAAQINGIPLYLDDDHLDDAGARFVVDAILSQLPPSQ